MNGRWVVFLDTRPINPCRTMRGGQPSDNPAACVAPRRTSTEANGDRLVQLREQVAVAVGLLGAKPEVGVPAATEWHPPDR